VPLNYRHHPTGGRSNPMGDYVDGPAGPLWPFGFGLGYARFELANLRLERTTLDTSDGCVAISVDITNVSDRSGEEVVQLYVRDEEATVARPSIELRGFQRVALSPGEMRSIEFTLYAEQLAYTGADNRRIIEPGLLSVFVGRSAKDLPLGTTLAMVGPIVELPLRRHSLGAARVI
jgi:beta-glucosidase